MTEENTKTAPTESEVHESDMADEAPEPRVYELGYHIVPTVSEEAVSDSVDALKRYITDVGGALISEEAPKHCELAYTMVKESPRGKERYDTAYFGWVKFECIPEKVAMLKEQLDENEELLRYLLIQTVREDTRAPRPATPEESEQVQSEEEGEEEAPATQEPSEKSSEADIDRAVDELVEGSEEEKRT